MGKASVLVLFPLLLMGFAAAAEVSFQGASNVSNWVESTDEEGVRTVTVYGGITRGATSCGSTPCNTCDGGGLVPCNEREVAPGMTVRFQGRTTDLQTGSRRGILKVESDTGALVAEGSTVDGSGNFFVDVPWSALCAAMSGGSNTCANDASQIFRLGVAQAGDTGFLSGQSMSIRVIMSNASGRAFYQRCKAGVGAGSGEGFCDFAVSPGDGKLYIDGDGGGDFIRTSLGFPNVGSSSLKFTRLVFFFEPFDGSLSSTLARITNGSSRAELPYTNTQNPPDDLDPRVTGLANDTKYCLLMANQDEAGNISNFTNVADSSYASDPNLEATLCGTPKEVVGLLDDKKCFIATAAWGSPLDPHVTTLRSFRDRFLKTTSWGNAFVEAYYSWSPPWAQWIRQHEAARVLVRGALWPLIAFAWLSLEIGVLATVALLAAFLGGSCAAVFHFGSRRRFKA